MFSDALTWLASEVSVRIREALNTAFSDLRKRAYELT